MIQIYIYLYIDIEIDNITYSLLYRSLCALRESDVTAPFLITVTRIATRDTDPCRSHNSYNTTL